MANRTKTSMSASDRVSAATFLTGINYADRTVEVKGDYKRLAFLSFDTLELEWIAKRVPPDVRDYIVADAAKIQARRGQQYQTSQAGQTVMLGSSSSAPKSPAQLDREIEAVLSNDGTEDRPYIVDGERFSSYMTAIRSAKVSGSRVVELRADGTEIQRWAPAASAKTRTRHFMVNSDGTEVEIGKVRR